MSDINLALNWMRQRVGKVTYSMASRLGPNSYDCSSSVYSALIAGGFLPVGTNLGNTETLFNDLERNGWEQMQPDANGNYPAKKGDIFIWGPRGATLGAAGHTGIFVDDSDNIIHCNYGYNGITINDHDAIWMYNGCPPIAVYRYKGKINNSANTNKPDAQTPATNNNRVSMSGTFYPDRRLAVSADTNPDDVASPALDYYEAGMAIAYDSYIMANGYAWISYIATSGTRRYVAVGPDDGRIDTTWGRGFFN